MYIGFDAKRAFLNRTGLGNYSRFVISGLLDMYPEHHYSLFTPVRNRNVKFAQGADVISAPSFFPGKTSSLWRSLFLTSSLKKRKIDVFHGLSNELPAGISRSGAASVVTIHDLIFLRYPDYYRSFDRAIYKKKFLSACDSADMIIAASCQTKEDIVSFFGIKDEKVRVVYQDCDSSFHSVPDEADLLRVRNKYQLPEKFFLTLGTVEERKNQLVILKALKKAGRLDYPLVISGKKTGYFKQLRDYIAENNLSERVVFLDYVDFADLPSLYCLSSALIYPSLFEGFGIPVVEAMNLGIPVITSRGTCMQEVAQDAAAYFDAQNQEELAHVMNTLVMDDSLRTEMIVKGKERAKLFRKEVVIPQTMDIYKKLAGR